MTVKHLGNQEYQGLAADTKPTNAAVNAQFYETDTGKLYRYNGTSWRPEYIKNPASMIVFKEGTTYYAQEADGTIVSSSTTDASIPINYAINNIPGAAARGYGGRIFIFAADYDCKTTINADFFTTAYNAIELEGEGKGTRLRFTPSSALTNGIFLRVSRPRLAHMQIYGNANVTNLVYAQGQNVASPLAVTRSDYGLIEGIEFLGANVIENQDQPAPVAGQVGFLKDGTNDNSHGSTFQWIIRDCWLRSLDIGMYARGTKSTSSYWNNINPMFCTTGLKLSSGENRVQGLYTSGHLYGRYGVHLADDGLGQGSGNNLTNIETELYAPGLEAAAVLIDRGCTSNRLVNIFPHDGAMNDHEFRIGVIDKNPDPSNYIYDNDIHSPSAVRQGRGWWYPALQQIGREEGILRGNVVQNGGTVTYTQFGRPYARLGTGTTVNTVSSYYHNNAAANMILAGYEPELQVRFIPKESTNLRIFIGLRDLFTAPTTSADPLNARKGVGLWVDTDITTQWKVMHNDGVGASTLTAIAGNPTISTASTIKTDIYKYLVTNYGLGIPPPEPPVEKATVTFCQSSTYVRTTVTTNIPTAADTLGWVISIENTLGANKRLDISDIELTHVT